MGAAAEMKKSSALVLLVLALTACRQEGRTYHEFTEAAEQTSTSLGDTALRPMPVVPHPRDTFAVPQPSTTGSLSFALTAQAEQKPAGRGTLKANGHSTLATIHLTFPAGAGTHEGVIHSGRCAKLGPTVTDLHPVSTDSLGAGSSASYINIPLDTLRVRPHAVVYGKGGRPHTCGDIS
jgi:hypothetical protein